MRNKWTEEEKQIIYDNYNNLSDIELSELIPRHSFLSIVTERKKLRKLQFQIEHLVERVLLKHPLITQQYRWMIRSRVQRQGYDVP